MANLIVQIALRILRVASSSALFLESQRLIFNLLLPTSIHHLEKAENKVLASLQSPIIHEYPRITIADYDNEKDTETDSEQTQCHPQQQHPGLTFHTRHLSSVSLKPCFSCSSMCSSNSSSHLCQHSQHSLSPQVGYSPSSPGNTKDDSKKSLLIPCSLGSACSDDHSYQDWDEPYEDKRTGLSFIIHTLVAGSKNAKPLALIHGHSMSSAFFYKNIDDLVDLGFCVYAVDLPGWGRSDRPEFSGESIDDALAWYMEPFTAWADATFGTTPFDIVAHSLGAYIALDYAHRRPHTVKSLCLVAPACITPSISWIRALYFAITPQWILRRSGFLGYLLFRLRYPNDETYTANYLRDYTYHVSARGPKGSGEVAAKKMLRFENWGLKPIISRPLIQWVGSPIYTDIEPLRQIPIRLVAGEIDSVLNLADVELLDTYLKQAGFKSTLYVIKGSDHCPFLEKPESFRKIMAQI